MSINNNTIEEIKNRCNIVDVIGQVVQLKKAGSNYKGLCPFHNEKTPSFVVSETKQIFTCFGCGVSGNVIEFVKRYYNLDFLEAVEKLATDYNIEFRKSGYNSDKNDKLYEINKAAATFFYKSMRESSNAGYSYMAGRGINETTLNTWGIGYADEKWDSLYIYLKSCNFNDDDIIKLGLVSRSSKDNKCYDRFRSRVIFPIINTRGKVIGFGGRIIDGGEPKYLNSPETPVFSKKNNLYGINITRKAIGHEDAAILVEGYMDVISLYQGGVENVCASLGTALTDNQARMLKRYTRNVYLSYDSDEAGRNAALRGIEILHKEECRARVLHVDDGKDPDEFIRKNGKEAFRKLLSNALPYAEYRIDAINKQYDLDDTDQRVQYVKAAVNILKALSPAEADIYIKRIAQVSNISEGAIRLELRDSGDTAAEQQTQYNNRNISVHNNSRESSDDITITEKTLIKILLTDTQYWDEIASFDYAFTSISGSIIYKSLKELHREDQEIDINKLADSLQSNENIILRDIIDNVHLGGKVEDVLYDCIQTLELRDLQEQHQELVSIISMAEESGSQEHIHRLMNREMMLQRRIQALKERGE